MIVCFEFSVCIQFALSLSFVKIEGCGIYFMSCRKNDQVVETQMKRIYMLGIIIINLVQFRATFIEEECYGNVST